jgi:hypothetical protein
MACVLVRVGVRVRILGCIQLVGERTIDQGLTRQGWHGHAVACGELGKRRIHRGDRILPENQEGSQEEEGRQSVHNE